MSFEIGDRVVVQVVVWKEPYDKSVREPARGRIEQVHKSEWSGNVTVAVRLDDGAITQRFADDVHPLDVVARLSELLA